jgi:lipoate-protein ligase A
MAVDEALLGSQRPDARWVLRFYSWSQPTLSLGYFQRAADRQQHPYSASCPSVRRPSGGGAILHDNELTYCAVVPRTEDRTRQPERLYEAFHSALIRAVADCGVGDARFCGDSITPRSPEPFLCFARRSPLDVMLGDAKIAGSAQRRRATAVLMHGSVLLKASPFAPELPGISDLAGRSLCGETLAAAWLHRLAAALNWTPIPGELTLDERTEAERLCATKYAAATWNDRR